MQARHPQEHTMRDEECPRQQIAKLMPIVTLRRLDGATELCRHISEEI
jgi:hypothetical protein